MMHHFLTRNNIKLLKTSGNSWRGSSSNIKNQKLQQGARAYHLFNRFNTASNHSSSPSLSSTPSSLRYRVHNNLTNIHITRRFNSQTTTTNSNNNNIINNSNTNNNTSTSNNNQIQNPTTNETKIENLTKFWKVWKFANIRRPERRKTCTPQD